MSGHRITIKIIIAVAFATTLVVGESNVTSASSNTSRTILAGAAVPLTLSLQPAVVVGGNQTTATITLSAAAPAGGIEITLRSLNSEVARFGGAIAAIGTSQLKIPEGSVSATFPVRTLGVNVRTDVTLQALSVGSVASATVTVDPASVRTLTITPSKLIGGDSATGTASLDGIAPANGGFSIKLTANSTAASVPASVTVAPGGSSATFAINTAPVSFDTPVIVTAGTVGQAGDGSVRSINGASAVVTVFAPVPSNLLLSPGTVSGGNASIGTVVLTGKAPSGGLVLGLSAGSSDATVPPSLTISAGTDRQGFKILTQTVCTSRTVAIKALLVHSNPQPTLSDGSVRSVVITDGSSNTIVIGESRAPLTASLLITPTVTSNNTTNPSAASSTTLSVGSSSPPALTITAQPSPATAGAPVSLTLNVPSVVTPCPQAGSIALASDHPELLRLPASVPVQTASQNTAGPQTVIVNATTTAATADQNVTITATGFSSSASTTLLIKQTPPPIASFTLRPTTVTGGSNIIAQITLSSTAPNSVTVNLSTDHPELVTVPATVTIPRSTVPTPLTFRTSPAATQTTVTITASSGSQTTSAIVNVGP